MFENIFSGAALENNPDALLALTEQLEANTAEAVKAQRKHARVNFRARVAAQPGNSGERHKFTINGVSGDISCGGCLVLFPMPLNVGNIYQLTFESEHFKVEPQFARCMRCRLIREDAFETGFKFFSSIQLPSNSENFEDIL